MRNIKVYNNRLFFPNIRSKNFSCNPLRKGGMEAFPFRSIVRLGSITPTNEIYPNRNNIVEVNSVESISNCRSKLNMKSCFKEANIPQSKWYLYNGDNTFKDLYMYPEEVLVNIEDLPYPILAKRIYGFKGIGMAKLNNFEELSQWINNNNLRGYYFEEFKNYNREYRLHCTNEGCFYSARKMLKSDIPDENRWFRNDSNCVWITEYKVIKDNDTIIGYDETIPNETFDKPINWNDIVESCVKALTATKLDIGAFDVKIQSSKDRNGKINPNPEFIIIELNSAPSFGEITIKKYKEEITKLLFKKYENL